MKPSDVDSIVIHCTATAEGKDYTVADIDRWHREKGYKKIGYHYVIYRDGTVAQGRNVTEQGAHCNSKGTSGKSYNTHSIGICYVGGLDKTGKLAKDTRTPEQKVAMRELVAVLCQKFPITDILGHRDTSPDLDGDGVVEPCEWLKSCPSFEVRDEFPMRKST